MASPLGKGTVSKRTVELTSQVSPFHYKKTNKVTFLIIDSPDHHLILGYSWLAQHVPLISWKQVEILKSSDYCQTHCLTMPYLATTVECPCREMPPVP